ncbi:DUF1232 domain-containing protein [Nocardioides sp. CN2-186]|uniref:YkvA family protein n=1 Tax=Nocardioides tweenelious TaxID=3156607 RepID=UPI0032B365C7
MGWWELLAGAVVGLVAVWLALIATLLWVGRSQDDPTRLRDVARLVPDVVRLFRRLAADPTLPRGVRVRMGLLVGYLLLPVDLVPDFIPVVGYADDALIVIWALRSITRKAGPDALDRHWPGSPEGLDALKRIAGVAGPASP